MTQKQVEDYLPLRPFPIMPNAIPQTVTYPYFDLPHTCTYIPPATGKNSNFRAPLIS